MKTTTCDVCGEKASATFEIYSHATGFRPLWGLHVDTLRMAGKIVDLCDEHKQAVTDLWPVAERAR